MKLFRTLFGIVATLALALTLPLGDGGARAAIVANQCVTALGPNTIGTSTACDVADTFSVSTIDVLAVTSIKAVVNTIDAGGYHIVGFGGGRFRRQGCSYDGYTCVTSAGGATWYRTTYSGSVYEAGAYCNAVDSTLAGKTPIAITSGASTFTTTDTALLVWAQTELAAGRSPRISIFGAGASSGTLNAHISSISGTTSGSTVTLDTTAGTTTPRYYATAADSITNHGTGYDDPQEEWVTPITASAGSTFTTTDTTLLQDAKEQLDYGVQPTIWIEDADEDGHLLVTRITAVSGVISGSTVTLADAIENADGVEDALAHLFRNEYITLNDGGTVMTITDTDEDDGSIKNAVVTGQVALTSLPSNPRSQSTVSGGGSGFAMNITYKHTGNYAYGTDDYTAINKVLTSSPAGVRTIAPRARCAFYQALPLTGSMYLQGLGRDESVFVLLATVDEFIPVSGTASIQSIRFDAYRNARATCAYNSGSGHFANEVGCDNGTETEWEHEATIRAGFVQGTTNKDNFPIASQRSPYCWHRLSGGADSLTDRLSCASAGIVSVIGGASDHFRVANVFGGSPFQPDFCFEAKGNFFLDSDQCGNARIGYVHKIGPLGNITNLEIQSGHSGDSRNAYGIIMERGTNHATIRGCAAEGGIDEGKHLDEDKLIYQIGGIAASGGDNDISCPGASYADVPPPAATSLSPYIFPQSPGGRAVLGQTTNCDLAELVPTANRTNRPTVCYIPAVNGFFPHWNVDHWEAIDFTTTGANPGWLRLSLDADHGHTGYQASGSTYDGFITLDPDAGSVSSVIGTNTTPWPAGNSNFAARGLVLKNGFWVNSAPITIRISDQAGSTRTCAAYECVAIFSIYMTGDGVSSVITIPSAAAGGGAAIVAISNFYNRRTLSLISIDNGSNWNCTACASTWEPLDVGATGSGLNNRLSWLDATAQVMPRITLTAPLSSTGGTTPRIGACFDAANCTPSPQASQNNQGGAATQVVSVTWNGTAFPGFGLHYAQAMQQSNASLAAQFQSNAELFGAVEY